MPTYSKDNHKIDKYNTFSHFFNYWNKNPNCYMYFK